MTSDVNDELERAQADELTRCACQEAGYQTRDGGGRHGRGNGRWMRWPGAGETGA